MSITTRIIATARYAPSRVVQNSFFTHLDEDPDTWIASRTGIRQRRFAADDESTSTMATNAAATLLSDHQIDPLSIDLIVLATSTPDMTLPQTAAMVQKNIGARNAVAYDVNAVCSGFAFALDTADSFLKAGKGKRALVIGADLYSRTLDFTDKSSCFIFGDGASCALLERGDQGGATLLASKIASDGGSWELITVPSSGSAKPITPETIAAGETTFQMAGKQVFVFAVERIPPFMRELATLAGISLDNIDYVIPHQANVRIINKISGATGMPKEKFLTNLTDFGNTAAASVGMVLDESWRKGLFTSGTRLMMLGFGGGLSWGGCVLQF